MTQTPYPVVIYAGSNAPALDGTRVITIAPNDASIDEVLRAVRDSGLSTSDLRNKAVFLTDIDPTRAAATYAAICGFAGRRLDVAAEGKTFRGQALDQLGRRLESTGRPKDPIRCAQYGAVHPDLVSLEGVVEDPETVAVLRFAKRLRFVPSASTYETLAALVVIGGIRAKGTLDRLPFCVTGDEPVGDDPTAPVGICLDSLKREGAGLKRAQRSDDRSAIADLDTDVSDRRRQIHQAADLPFARALEVVGARASKDPEMWHCPRPRNHANGDATASFKVVENSGHCPRCDVDPIDGLRLVVEVLGVSVDEAASLLQTR
jgi:hypothetical protein